MIFQRRNSHYWRYKIWPHWGQTIGIKTMAVSWGFDILKSYFTLTRVYIICHSPPEILETLKNRLTNSDKLIFTTLLTNLRAVCIKGAAWIWSSTVAGSWTSTWHCFEWTTAPEAFAYLLDHLTTGNNCFQVEVGNTSHFSHTSSCIRTLFPAVFPFLIEQFPICWLCRSHCSICCISCLFLSSFCAAAGALLQQVSLALVEQLLSIIDLERHLTPQFVLHRSNLHWSNY